MNINKLKIILIPEINAHCDCPTSGLDVVATPPYVAPTAGQCLRLPTEAKEFTVILNITVTSECMHLVTDRKVRYEISFI